MSQQKNELIQKENLTVTIDEVEIDLFGLIQIIGEEKWLLLSLPFICSCVAAVISLYLTPMYTAKATFIAPEKQLSSASAALDQLGGLGSLAGNLSKNPNEMYIALMQSNTVQDMIIAELHLMQRYKTRNQEDTRQKLLSLVKITTDKKSSLITIEAQDESPDVAAKLANAYLKPFRMVLNRISLEEAQMRIDFFAQQIQVIAQRPFRDPFVQSTLLNSMIKQYEAARIDEGRKSQILFQLDFAKTPERRSSPKRTALVLSTGLAIFFLTLLWIFIKRAVLHAQNNSLLSPKWERMKKSWKLRP
jgi:capsular polysaccharide biosynthesis protein